MHPMWKRSPVWVACFVAGCAGGGPSAEELAGTIVAQTAAAATPTPLPSDTPLPTDTPLPPTATSTVTVTPTPGPVVFQDDFSAPSSAWVFCEECEVRDGALFMGPYPISGAYLQHTAICGPCGLVRNYRMSVDVAYGEGPSERGFGLLVRMTDEAMMTFEITPWQTAILWNLDFEDRLWDFVNGFYTGRVRAGRATNSIEVEVQDGTTPATVNIELRVSGRTIFIAYNRPGDLGVVGLTLYGHAMSAVFDNFVFEELPPYLHEPIPSSGPPGESASAGGEGTSS
jgi:hypothetical protein